MFPWGPKLPAHSKHPRIFGGLDGWECDRKPQMGSQPWSEIRFATSKTQSDGSGQKQHEGVRALTPHRRFLLCSPLLLLHPRLASSHCLAHVFSQLLTKALLDFQVPAQTPHGPQPLVGVDSRAWALRWVHTRIPHPWRQLSWVCSQVSNTSRASVSIPRLCCEDC